jgi:hypothetical protein
MSTVKKLKGRAAAATLARELVNKKKTKKKNTFRLKAGESVTVRLPDRALPPKAEVQLLRKLLFDIDTAAVMLPTFAVTHNGGPEAAVRNIIEAIKKADERLRGHSDPAVIGPPSLLEAQEILRQYERDTRDDQGTVHGRSAETVQFIDQMQLALNRVSAGLKEDPLNVVQKGVPPTLRPEEIEDMRLLIIDVKGLLERMATLVIGNDPLGSRSPVGRALDNMVKLDHLAMVAEARLNSVPRSKGTDR